MNIDPLRLFRPPPARNLVLAASAGTGKTHALVGVVLHRVLSGPSDAPDGEPVDPGRIVATTFSRKAAAEIRTRITRELDRLAEAPSTSVYFPDLAARSEGASDVPKFVASRARRALARIDAARFGTFHSFATGFVRAHAVALGLGPGFDLATEEEGRSAVEDALARAIEARLATDARELHAVAEAAGGIDALVSELASVVTRLEEDGRPPRELLLATDDEALIEAQLSKVASHAEALTAVPRWAEAARRVVDVLGARDEGRMEEVMRDLFSMRATGKDAAVQAFAEFRQGLPGTTNEQRGRRLVRLYLARRKFIPRASLVRDVLAEAHDDLQARSRAEARLGFGDILRACRELFRDHPDIATREASDIDALLVDEFQDTSRVQRDLLQLLWATPPSRRRGEVPKVEALRGKGLLVVGDRKQSIYGFRGADVGVFAELAVGLAGEPARIALGIPEGVSSVPAEPLADFCALRDNRRSHEDILRFANAFSARRFVPRDADVKLYEIAYVADTEDLRVPSTSRPESGLEDPARAHEAEAPGPDGTAEGLASRRITWLKVAPRKRTSSRIEEALVIASEVRSIVAHGLPRVGKDGRAPRYRDMAVLATSHAMLDATAFALAQAQIPYVLAGRYFFRTREVRDLAAWLALVTDPNDGRAAVTVLRGPWGGVHDETLLGLTRPRGGLCPPSEWTRPPHPELVREEDRETLASLSTLLADLERCAFRIGPSEVLRQGLRERRMEEVLALLPRGEQRIANVRKLVAIAEKHADVRAFRAWLDGAADQEFVESEAATFSEEDDAVRLLTVHASKGLDFPIVFVPQVCAGSGRATHGSQRLLIGSGNEANVLAVRVADDEGELLESPAFSRAGADAQRRDRAERQRLSYVAVTRAADAILFVGGRASSTAVDPGTSSLGVLEALQSDPEALAASGMVVRDVEAKVPRGGSASAVSGPELTTEAEPVPQVAASRAWRALSLAPTALADFDHCARRFELVHVLGLPERPRVRTPSGEATNTSGALDARAQGTLAHAALEHVPLEAFAGSHASAHASTALVAQGLGADHPLHEAIVGRVTRFLESDYARSVSDGQARLRREVDFVLAVDDSEGRRVVLRGSMDLVAVWPDGSVDVLDYKSGRRSPGGDPSEGAAGAHAFQLDVYALAARSLYPDAVRVRVGLVFLGGDAHRPVWREPPDDAEFRRHIARLGHRLVEGRSTGVFPRVDVARCEAIYCGFIRRCHPASPNDTRAYEVAETTT